MRADQIQARAVAKVVLVALSYAARAVLIAIAVLRSTAARATRSSG